MVRKNWGVSPLGILATLVYPDSLVTLVSDVEKWQYGDQENGKESHGIMRFIYFFFIGFFLVFLPFSLLLFLFLKYTETGLNFWLIIGIGRLSLLKYHYIVRKKSRGQKEEFLSRRRASNSFFLYIKNKLNYLWEMLKIFSFNRMIWSGRWNTYCLSQKSTIHWNSSVLSIFGSKFIIDMDKISWGIQ